MSDTDFALNKGLFADSFRSAEFEKSGHPSKVDFIELAKRVDVTESRIEKLILPYLEKQNLVEELINRSFLDEANKRGYLLLYNTKRNMLLG